MKRIVIVAGEASGDRLGAGLIRSLRGCIPGLVVEGVGGPRMIAAGCQALHSMERLAVMGVVEIIGHYGELWMLRRRLIQRLRVHPPDLFIGIDAPDFNLELEERLRAVGIPTVHYVSPQVWAWREGRLAKITRAVDLMLTLFPFEEDYYRRHGVPVRFVGHPLADEVSFPTDKTRTRAELGLPQAATVIALLPGSRANEWRQHTEPFIRAAEWLSRCRASLYFAVPLVSVAARQEFERIWVRIARDLAVSVYDGHSLKVLAAADVVLTVSGTATLESLLLRRPMVIAYRMAVLTYLVTRVMVDLPYYTLPNLLAGSRLVPELIQRQVTPKNLGRRLLYWLDHPDKVAALQTQFATIESQLRRNANQRAADAVLELVAG